MFFAISLLYCSFAVYIKQQCPPKRASFLRFLAESNCCKRFCRPVPNHSAKEPCCGFASANLGIIFGICKFYAVYFSFSVYFWLNFDFYACKNTSWQHWTINISGISVFTFIKIFLITIKNILNSGIYLQC